MKDNEIINSFGEVCGDNRFELIKKYKNELFEHTNIATSTNEVAVLDSLLFRFWQMGWLDKLEDYNRQNAEIDELQHKIASYNSEKAELKAEIEELKKVIETMTNEQLLFGFESKEKIKQAKTEAIKEFAEKFKEKAGSIVTSCQGYEIYETKQYQISAINFDNLVEEMTEGGVSDGI